MISIELYWDHDTFQALYCPHGTALAGKFDLTNLNNWQHASSYPAFFIAGLVDLTMILLPGLLPERTGQVMTGLAFAAMSFLMGTHQKHEPLDLMMHWLLFVAMLLIAVMHIVELNAPHNPLVSLGKAASVMLTGAWMCMIGTVMFYNLPQWSTDYNGGQMIAPVYFVSIAVILVLGLLVLVVTLEILIRKGWLRANMYTLLSGTLQEENLSPYPHDKKNVQMSSAPFHKRVFSGDSAELSTSEDGDGAYNHPHLLNNNV